MSCKSLGGKKTHNQRHEQRADLENSAPRSWKVLQVRAVDGGLQSRKKKSVGGLGTNLERILNGISEVYLAIYFYLKRICSQFSWYFYACFPTWRPFLF